jgi:hypothetical protein
MFLYQNVLSLDCDEPLIEGDKNVKLSSTYPNTKPNDARLNSKNAWCTDGKIGKYLQVSHGQQLTVSYSVCEYCKARTSQWTSKNRNSKNFE